jgi:hypothetical protein
MPKLLPADRRQTTKLTLPSTKLHPEDPAWVEIYTEVLAGDMEVMADAFELKGHASLIGVVNLIKDWNFEDEDGNKSEINIENLRRLTRDDFIFLSDEIVKIKQPESLTEDVKKN